MLVSVGLLGVEWSAFAFHGHMGPHSDAHVSVADRKGEYNMIILSCVIPLDTDECPHSEVSRELVYGYQRNFVAGEGLLALTKYNNNTCNSYLALDDVRGLSNDKIAHFTGSKVLFLTFKKAVILIIFCIIIRV